MLRTPETQIRTEKLENEQKSFDILATVNMFRFDIENFGRILPETRERGYDEELTFVAEGMNRPLYTRFNLKEKNGCLAYFNNGEWQPYISTLITGLKTAEREANEDSQKNFLADRANRDLKMGYKLESLAPGKSIKWYSSFPSKERRLYGEEFIADCGFQPERETGFIYKATKNYGGSLTLESHSVDNSDDDAFEAAMQSSDESGIKGMVAAYDAILSRKHGKEFSAGREAGELPEENAWEILQANKDLVEWYFEEIEIFANQPDSQQLESKKTVLTYGFWAAIKKRMDSQTIGAGIGNVSYAPRSFTVPPSQEVIAEEVRRATIDLASKGEQLVGCGGSISMDKLTEVSPEKVLDAIFGEEKQPWYGKKKKNGKCVNCKEEGKVGEKDWCEKCISGHCGSK